MNIHTFGDSHASDKHSHWGYINMADINMADVKIKCNHIGGRLMFTFGRLGLNLLNIKDYAVEEDDVVIFCFGEIDCRNHVHKHITKEKSYKNVIEEIVRNYFNAIRENVSQYNNLKTCVYNVVPPHRYRDEPKYHRYPFLGSDIERREYYLYMNQLLRELCIENNYFYFDIYDESCDEEGFIKDEFSDGNVHLRNTTHSIEVIKRLLIEK